LKHGRFGLNIRKSFLAVSLVNQGIDLPGRAVDVLLLEVFENWLFYQEWVRKSRSSLGGEEVD